MRKVISRIGGIGLFLALAFPPPVLGAGRAEHVVVIVWDGMRPDFISPERTPTLHQLARDGVMFQNHHAVFCTATEVNGTALATGVYPEHSGIMANHMYLPEVNPLKTVDTQATDVVRKGDQLTGGHYLLRPTLAEILQAAGRKTVVAGTKQVALLQDRRERPEDYPAGVILFEGKTLPAAASSNIQALLGKFPAEADKASLLPNEPRDEWTTRALLGSLWSNGVPAFSLLWLSEPDYSQHPGGPGSPKALAAIESSDRKLALVLADLEQRGLRDKTDVFVVSDHGFSTVERAVDVCKLLRDAGFSAKREFKSPPKPGDILVAGQGGSVLFYVMEHDKKTVRKLVGFLQQQDFCGVLFTGRKMAGTFTLDQAGINAPQAPDVVMSMRWSSAKSNTGAPGLFAMDSSGPPNAGSHASLSPFDGHNILIGAGPDLKSRFTDTLPTGNMDLAPTVLWLLDVKPKQPMDGRVLSEALTSLGAPPVSEPATERLEAVREQEGSTWRQYLQTSRVNRTVYLDEGNGARIPK